VDRSLRGKVKLLIDDARVEVWDGELVLFVEFESNLRIAYMSIFEAANIHEED
jgi:hypothetical protein